MAAKPTVAPSGRLAKLTAANMLRSMLPLVVMVLALAYFCSPQNPDPVVEIDPSNSIRYAASLALVAIPVPELAETWRPTSAEVDPPADGQPGRVTLTIGYVTPQVSFARYVVSTDPAAELIENLLLDADREAALTIAGQPWEEFTTNRNERLYLASFGDLRLLVTGSASQEELRTLAASLTPYRP
jgi:hypothetical protein